TDQLHRIVHGQTLLQSGHHDVGLEFTQAFGNHLNLGPAHIGGTEEDLPVDVGDVHGVIINDGDVSNASGGERLHGGTPQASTTDDQHMGTVETFLLLHAPSRQRQLAGGAAQFGVGK